MASHAHGTTEAAHASRESAQESETLVNQRTEVAGQAATSGESHENRNLEVLDEEAALKRFTTNVRDQDDLERDISHRANLALIEAEDKKDQDRIEKAQTAIRGCQSRKSRHIAAVRQNHTSFSKQLVDRLDADIDTAEHNIASYQARIAQRHQDNSSGADLVPGGKVKPANESQRDFLIRTGQITPFSNIGGPRSKGVQGNLASAPVDTEDDAVAEHPEKRAGEEPRSHRNLRAPGFADEPELPTAKAKSEFSLPPSKKGRTQKDAGSPGDSTSDAAISNAAKAKSELSLPLSQKRRRQKDVESPGNSTSITGVSDAADSESDFSLPPSKKRQTQKDAKSPGESTPGVAVTDVANVESEFSLRPRKKRRIQNDADSPGDSTSGAAISDVTSPETNFVVDDEEESDDYDLTAKPVIRRARSAKVEKKMDLSKVDDGNEAIYEARLADWIQRRRAARHEHNSTIDHGEKPEWLLPLPHEPDLELTDGIKLPGDIHPALYDYQKTGIQWLSELYKQKVGGILGDEMGLGKTVQVISFLAALHYSQMLDKPVIVVAPATVMKQWVNEFHKWWPAMRVSILHSSGSGMVGVRDKARLSDEERSWDGQKEVSKTSKASRNIVDRVVKQGHVLVTTYEGLKDHADLLIPVEWGYSVLDEGHKIRNPNSEWTIHCKELKTPHRVILSGTPMQNNLTELWSLFDFIFPMRLGTLVDFRGEFELPIKEGGYSRASNIRIMTAQKCAETLKETISPYLLQRFKADVAADLPKKTERVLFCKMTSWQQREYEQFLKSDDVNAILRKSKNPLFGIGNLRKICNHPDLLDPPSKEQDSYKWGMPSKSGKMEVLESLLPIWKKYGHKILLFSQSRQMLNILEKFVQRLSKDGVAFNYLRMDGTTPTKDRQNLVDRFNDDPDVDVFLLTTKVGGLGINLTSASRVVIYDPDWNPSTDMQARERAWRLGQKKEVDIYRFMMAGTIEEKIYHRQVFKQFLSNKVLKDPTTRANFSSSDLNDLFTLGDSKGETETSRLFRDAQVQITGTPSDSPNNQLVGSGATSGDGNEAHDIHDITGVASLEDDTSDQQLPSSTEARIMEGIFARSTAFRGAVDHDHVINGSSTSDSRVADACARDSIVHLRRTGQQARTVPAGTVTWTGKFGTTGRPPDNIRRGRDGPGSSAILSGLAEKQGLGAGSTGLVSRPVTKYKRKELEKLIPDYIRSHSGTLGKVRAKLLEDHFNYHSLSKAQKAEFNDVLRKVATPSHTGFSKSARHFWHLKE